MASGTVVSRVLGLGKMLLLAYAIGSVGSRSADAFSIGMELANWVYFLLIGGMLNAVLVPQIVRAAKDPDGGHGYINKLFTLVAVVLFGITVIAVVAAPFIVFINQVNWPAEQLALATAFAYWCMPQILFYGLYVVMGEVLNARSVFGPYTWAPVINNVVGILGLVGFILLFGADPNGLRTEVDWTAASIAVLAGSATLGVAVQALILFIPWRRAGIRYRPDFTWRGMGLGRTVRIATWSFAALIVAQVATLVNNNVIGLGSGAGPSNSALQNAAMVFMVPHSVIAVSLATAYFTRLSHSANDGNLTAFREDFSASMRNIMTVMMMFMMMLFVTAPFISRIINFGASPERVEQFWPVLQAYLVSLVAFSCYFVTQRAFYALSDTKTPFFVVLLSQSLMVGMALSLPFVWQVPARYIGVSFAAVWSVAQIFSVVLSIVLLRRKIHRIDGRRILVSAGRSVGAALPALVVGLGGTLAVRIAVPDVGVGLAMLCTAVISVVVAVIYLVMLRMLRSPELDALVARVLKRRGSAREGNA